MTPMRSWFAITSRVHAATSTVAAGFLVALLLSLSGCSETPSEQDCTNLLDHLIELEIKAAGTEKLTPEMRADLDDQRKQLKEYMTDKFIEKCKSTIPVPVVQCGLQAKSIADYAACERQ